MTKIISIAVALLVGIGAIYAFTMSQDKKMMTDDMSDKEMMDKMEDKKMMDETMDDEMMKDAKEAMTAGSYEAYAPEKLARANNGKAVLFFKASWCPTCRALDADIKANLADIPEGLSILEVNYDSETALKQKYGVTYQHTLVQVDADGNLIKKWSGGLTLGTIEENLMN